MALMLSYLPLKEESSAQLLIRHSVRCALPWLLLSMSASSLNKLIPGRVSRWLMENRKEFGLAFAAVMAWQVVFIIHLVWLSGRNIRELFPGGWLGDLIFISDILGYTLVTLMVLTSFEFGRKLISPLVWRRLHVAGVWFLWFSYFYTFGLFMLWQETIVDSILYVALWCVTLIPVLLRLLSMRASAKEKQEGATG